MELYLFVLVVKWEKAFKIVYKDDGKPAVYTDSDEAWIFQDKMSKKNPDGEYVVKQKHVKIELN